MGGGAGGGAGGKTSKEKNYIRNLRHRTRTCSSQKKGSSQASGRVSDQLELKAKRGVPGGVQTLKPFSGSGTCRAELTPLMEVG